MSHIHIPAEVLLQVLSHVRHNDDPNSHLDLLSCCMVSSFWFDCAWPLAAEFFNQGKTLDFDTYSTVQIGYVADVITKLRQFGDLKMTPFTSVVTINKLLFEQTAHGSRADATVRLVHALQPPSKTIEIHIPIRLSAKNAVNIQDFVFKLYSSATSLRIYGGRYDSEPLKTLEPLEQLSILIHDVRHQLQDITIAGTYPPSFIQALSNCPNIRRLSIGAHSNASDFMATVCSWPELRSLKILGNSEDIDPIVEQLAMNTPNHLESLHFDYCKTPQLRNLIISLAPRLVRLVLPFESTEGSDEFLALIASLDMPCLRHLGLSQLHDSLTAENVVQRHWVEGQNTPISLLRWPKLQRINLRSCFKISPLFLQLVIASCPALEGVRLGGRGKCGFRASRLPESEAILTDAGWTQSTRYIWYGCYVGSAISVVTFLRPGGNVWEVKEWLEAWKLDLFLREDNVDGVVIVSCI